MKQQRNRAGYGVLTEELTGYVRHKLCDGVAKTARTYRERDEQTAAEIVELTT